MADRGHTTEDISGWLTPRQTLDILEAAFPDKHSALRELQERLCGGLVIAACSKTSIDGYPIKAGVLNQIGAEDWDRAYADNDVWQSGTLSIRGGYREPGGYNSSKDIRFFDVRFNPDHVNDILRPHQKATPVREPEPEPEQVLEAARTPVSPANLQAWFEFYEKIGGEMKEDAAHAHARMCFPNHSITRQKIRDLLPERPMGRPKRDGA